MRINKAVTLGAIAGWFIVAPLVPPYRITSPIDLLWNAIIGILFSMLIGLLFASYDDYRDSKIRLNRAIRDYNRTVREHNRLVEIRKKLLNDMKNLKHGQPRTKPRSEKK